MLKCKRVTNKMILTNGTKRKMLGVGYLGWLVGRRLQWDDSPQAKSKGRQMVAWLSMGSFWLVIGNGNFITHGGLQFSRSPGIQDHFILIQY